MFSKPKYQKRIDMFDAWYKETRQEISKKFDELAKINDQSEETMDYWTAKIIRQAIRKA